MGLLENILGGIHLHKIFFPPTNNKFSLPLIYAEKYVETIKQNNKIYHEIYTLYILFIEKLGQVSDEQVCTIDIILRKIRQSQTPFGGVLGLGKMDNTQLQPIKHFPLIISSLIMTCFQMICLENSVRSYGDIEFQILQDITRTNPYVLM